MDPCENAVDEPSLYQHWGKNITNVVAFEVRKWRGVITDRTSVYSEDATMREESEEEVAEGEVRAEKRFTRRVRRMRWGREGGELI